MAGGPKPAASDASLKAKAVETAKAPPATSPALQPTPLASLPRLDIAKFRWSGIQLQLEDAAGPQLTSLTIDDAGIELDDLHIDLHPNAPVGNPGKIRMWMKAPGLAGNIGLEGTLVQHPGGLSADVQVKGEKLSVLLAGPYLKALNIEPTLRDGSLKASAHVDVTQTETELSATVSASDVSVADAGEEVFGVDKAEIGGVSVKAGLLSVDAISLVKPRGKLVHEENGAISAVGFRLLPVPPAPKKPQFAAAKNEPARPLPPAAEGPTTQPVVVATTQPVPAVDIISLKKFSIRDGALTWIDRAVKPAAQTTARVNGDIDEVTWGKPVTDPIHLSFAFKADDILDEAKIDGTATISPDSAGVKLQITATGLRDGALASYLPPGISLELKDGRFKGKLDAGVAMNPKGGISGQLTFSDLDYRDAQGDSPLFRLDAVKVAVGRVDIPAGIVAVDEISVTGADQRPQGERRSDPCPGHHDQSCSHDSADYPAGCRRG